MQTFKVPGKLFLIGEYGVIRGGKALIAAVRPGFQFSPCVRDATSAIHPEAPLGVYEKEIGKPLSMSLSQIGLGRGFGSSSAELVAGIFFQEQKLPETGRMWKWFKERFPHMSGADLATQLEAIRTNKGIFKIEGSFQIKPFVRGLLLDQIFVFQNRAEDKLATHEALRGKEEVIHSVDANPFVEEASHAFQLNQEKELAVFSRFADHLHELGLETEKANLIRKTFEGIPGVISAKGCGAGLNDVFIVAVRKSSLSVVPDIHGLARKHGLRDLGSLGDLIW